MARRPSAFQRAQGWAKRNLPTRESFEGNRFLKPVAHRVLVPALWRFTRRSVPRGVALGMFTGLLFPIAQIPLAALAALPLRANIPVAALTTFITNPITTPFFWAAGYYIGKRALRLDQVVPGDPLREAATSSWMQWLMSDAAPSLAVGLLIITAVGTVGGYFVTKWAWQGWIAHKWRTRHQHPIDPD